MAIFKNNQWEVIDFGMQALKPAPLYEIEAKRLVETTQRNGVTYYDWPCHMAIKTWVDGAAFNEAFVQALTIHVGCYFPAVDREMLERSLAYAQTLAAQR